MSADRRSNRPVVALFFAVSLAAPVAAQCGPQWQPGALVPGLGGSAYDAELLPSGDVVAAGSFVFADAQVVNHIARFDGTTWQPLGTGLDGIAYAVVRMPNGDIVAAGAFTQAGGTPASRIARWNGSSWAPLGGGLGDQVNALLVLPNGDLVAGGRFLSAGSAPASRIARWDGTTWTALGSGISGEVHCLALRANGDLIVGGNIAAAGGVAAQALATWNGTTWTAMPGLSHASYAFGLAGMPNGDIVAVGSLSIGSAVWQLVIANGTSVQAIAVPSGLWNEVSVLGNGDLLIGGYEVGMATGAVARWNGSVWTSLGNGAPGRTFRFLVRPGGNLVAAGSPLGTGVTARNAVAEFNGATWTALGAPAAARVTSLLSMPDGGVIVGGQFSSLRGVAANNIARWQNSVVSPLGAGIDGEVTAVSRAPDGSVVVAGNFANAGGGPATRIARWTGVWTTVGAGLPWAAEELATANGGQVIARSGSQTMYFDGATWSPLVLGASLLTFTGAPEGDFILGGVLNGQFGGFTGSVRFDHGVVSYLGTQPQPLINKLVQDAQGRVLARTIAVPLQILRLDGNTWSAIGGTFPFASPPFLTSLPNGDPLAVVGSVTGMFQLVRYDGSGWSVFEPSIAVGLAGSRPLVVAASPGGEVLLGGEVRAVQGVVTNGFAVATPACPAAASAVGTGCTGAAGPLSLRAGNLPWLGSTFRATAAGFTPASLGAHVIGTQATTLALPLGAPGCWLFTAPEAVELLLPSSGQAGMLVAVPRTASLVGLQVRTQVVGLELAANGSLLRLTSTNALQLTIGGL